MKRSTPIAFTVLLLLVLACGTLADRPSLDEVREDVLQRILAANVSTPVTGKGARNLQSYRIIEPYMIADLLSGVAFIYLTILEDYPDMSLYDMGDLRLQAARYVPQTLEFNYVKRV